MLSRWHRVKRPALARLAVQHKFCDDAGALTLCLNWLIIAQHPRRRSDFELFSYELIQIMLHPLTFLLPLGKMPLLLIGNCLKICLSESGLPSLMVKGKL
jgi:hypothetical protein